MNVEYISETKGYSGVNSYSQNLKQILQKIKNVKIYENSVISLKGVPIMFKKKVQGDLIHFTNQEQISPILTRRKRFIVTVHDLTVKKMNLFKHSGSSFGFLAAKLYEFKISCFKNARHIISVSENTKNDLINDLGISPKKITVIYEGISKDFKPDKRIKKQKNTLLYVGNELPHKNLKTLFEAIAIVKKLIPDIKLVKVGNPGWDWERKRLIKVANKLNIQKNIVFKNSVDDLVKEYNAAEALILPSLYEGFGLPVLEAMACGCPVICSNTSSLPEVGGNAVVYFNPLNPKDIAEKIIELLTDEKLRKKLSKLGLERVKNFSWENCAKETTEVYMR